MNFKLRHFILSTCFLFITTFTFAQKVFIANDFVACAVGLKDSSGKWIVEPIYQDINTMSGGYFKVLYGSKEGVINSEGKVVIPPIYDYVGYNRVRVDSTMQYFFTVTNKSVSGLLNSNNQLIIPITCRKIDVNYDGTVVAEKTRKRYSIYDLHGNEKVIPKKQGTAPESLGDRMFKVSRNSFGLTLVQRYFPKSKKAWRRYRYRLTLRKKYGVMNDSLHMIVPKKFSDVYYGPAKYNLLTVEKRKKAGFYNTAGKQIWAPVYKIDYAYRRNSYGYGSSQTIMNTFGFTAVMHNKKYGIIGVNGDTLLPFIYTSIDMPYGGHNSTSWKVELNGNDGIYNAAERKWVIEPVYQSLSVMATFRLADDTSSADDDGLYRAYSWNYNIENGLQLLIARKDGKYGVITSTGQDILPFVYDDYERSYNGFCLRKDTSYYMATVPQYMALQTEYTYQAMRNIVQKAPLDKKFKMINAENGVTLFINLDLADDSAQLSLYQEKPENYEMNPNTYDHRLHTAVLVVTPLSTTKNMTGIGKVYTYHTTNLTYRTGDDEEDFVIRSRPAYFNIYDVNVVARDDFHSYYSVGTVSGLFRDDGLTVIRPYSYNYYSYRDKLNGLAYFSVKCGKNKTGLIDGNGKLLLDTAWGQVGSMSGKYIWVKKKYHSAYWRDSYKWNILDTETNELLLDKKLRSNEGISFGKNAVIIARPEGLKLYNTDQRKYILDRNVRELMKLDSAGNFYAVRTCYGNIGIIDGNGKWLADTVWKMIINANNTPQSKLAPRYRSHYYYREKSMFQYCVLSNDTGLLIFDGYKGIVTKDAKTVHAMMAMAAAAYTIDSIHGVNKFCNDCPTYSFADTLRNKEQLTAWQERILFDSLFGPTFMPDTLHYWNSYGCTDCRKRNPKGYFEYTFSGNYDMESLHHYIGFKNESCISVARANMSGYSYNRRPDPKDLFFTVMLFNDGPHAMLLDSLFQGNEWKEFISNETNLYFESHPNIEGNCHNPYMLPVVMRDRFILTKNGIELYPPHYKENDHQLFVPISWEKLKPFLREDVAQKLGVKQ